MENNVQISFHCKYYVQIFFLYITIWWKNSSMAGFYLLLLITYTNMISIRINFSTLIFLRNDLCYACVIITTFNQFKYVF